MKNIEQSFPVLTVKEVIELERKIELTGGTLLNIMENAGFAIAEFIKTHIAKDYKQRQIYFICGTGNNCGDGIFAASALLEFNIESILVINEKPKTNLATIAMDKLLAKNRTKIINFEDVNFEEDALLIDALFGTGLKINSFDDKIKLIIEKTRKKEVISIDIPSGVNPDTAQIDDVAIMANHTLALGCMKKCHALFPGALYCGNTYVLDIGLGKIINPSIITSSKKIFQKELKPPSHLSHKYTRGHLMVIGGNKYTTGASILAAKAAQKTSSGIVTIYSEKCAADIYATKLYSIMLTVANRVKDLKEKIEKLKINSVVIGPGSGISKKTLDLTISLIKNKIPCVIDADSITAFQNKKDVLFDHLNKHKDIIAVLTPHDEEFQRLFTKTDCKVKSALLAAKQSNAIIVYKGPDTIIADPSGKAVINSNAPHNLATAGSGDVLSGIIGSLMSSGVSPWKSAIAGVWIHSEGARHLDRMLIAEEIIAQIPKVMQSLFYNK